MNRYKNYPVYAPWLVVVFLSLSISSFGQQKQRFFKYAAYPDKARGGRLAFAVTGKEMHVTKMDYSRKDQISFVFDFGSKKESTESYKKVHLPAFDKEPMEIRGHKLLGAYLNSNTGLYNLYYLAPDRASMLVKEFAQPGKLFFYCYFSDTRTNPFADLVLPFSLNDTIQLKPAPPPATRKASGK